MEMKIKLLGKNLDELKKLVADEGLPGFTAKQIAQWLYVRKVRTIDEMTNLSKVARAKLSEKYEVGVVPYAGLQVSSDGTKKYLFPVSCTHRRGLNLRVQEEELETSAIEAVMIPDQALQKQTGSSERFVYVLKNGEAEYRLVKDGRRVGDMIEIVEGLSADEEVATTSFTRLMSGKKVEIKNE